MADLVLNIALGRSTEFYVRVDTNDPVNAALIVTAWTTTALDSVIKDLETHADIQAEPGTAEVTNTGYARKTLTDADLVAFAPDHVNDRVDLDIPDQTFTAILAGDNWTDLGISFDKDTTAGTDADIVPMTWHDFVVVPDGSDILAQVNVDGFFRAS